MLFLIAFFFWFLCGTLSFGFGMAYWKAKYPVLHQRDYRQDCMVEIVGVFLGLIGLAINLSRGFNKLGKYGLSYRRVSKEDKIAQVERKLDRC